MKSLPPPPKLRPRPGFRQPLNSEGCQAVKDEEDEEPEPKVKQPPASSQEVIEDGKTSRLLTKSECKGGRGGRRKNPDGSGGSGGGSLIHSIPKFSQVMPKGGKISEVQKVLQSRLLMRQKAKDQLTKEDGPSSSSLTNLIQNLHEQRSSARSSSEAPPVSQGSDSANRRKSRKPLKYGVTKDTSPSPPKKVEDKGSSQVHHISPEVTITPTPVAPGTPQAPRQVPPVPTILTPDEYEKQGLPTGYIYWPNANIFVHTTVVFSSLLCPQANPPTAMAPHLQSSSQADTR